MLNNQFRISYIISTLLIVTFLVLFGFLHDENKEPIDVYNVYLNGKIIGVVKDKGSFEDYINFYGADKINMENLVHQSYDYFESGVFRFLGEEKLSKINQKFQNNYLTIRDYLIIILHYILNYNCIKFNLLICTLGI